VTKLTKAVWRMVGEGRDAFAVGIEPTERGGRIMVRPKHARVAYPIGVAALTALLVARSIDERRAARRRRGSVL